MVGVEGFSAVVGPGEAFPEEVPPVHGVPGLPDELVVHLVPESLDVLARGRHFVIAKRVLVVLGKRIKTFIYYLNNGNTNKFTDNFYYLLLKKRKYSKFIDKFY